MTIIIIAVAVVLFIVFILASYIKAPTDREIGRASCRERV